MSEPELRELPAPQGFSGRAVNTAAYGWLTLISPAEHDLWLCVGKTGPLVVDAIAFVGDGPDYRLLCGLLGMPWLELEGDLLPTVRWQQRCMRHFPRSMWAQFAGRSLEDVLEWRREVATMTAAEGLVMEATGAVDPRAVRN